MATNGMVNRLPPKPLSMPVNGTSVPLTTVEKGGILGVGSPPVTVPVIAKGISDLYWFSRNASSVPKITTIALRDSARYLFTVFHFSNVPIFWKLLIIIFKINVIIISAIIVHCSRR